MLNEDVIYLIMPARYGGINGVRKRLSYLTDLGITALWLTPVFKSMSYHGYDITDYYAVDKRYGTIDEYKALVEEAHERGLKVIMDIVFNHCGIHHPWFSNPPGKEWFNGYDDKKPLLTNYRLTPTTDPYASDYDKRKTIEGWFVKSMPDLNLRNKKLQNYFFKCTEWWIDTCNIDGIRIDTFPYTDRNSIESLMQKLHSAHPDFHIIGETWVTQPAFTAKMQEGELDSPMDFALFEAFGYAKHENTDKEWSGLNRIYNVLCYDYLYKKPASVMAFLDNHDVNRFLEDAEGEKLASLIRSLKMSLAIMLTLPRIPQIYYGTEILMSGTTERSDRDVRKVFPERCTTRNGRTKEENDMFNFLRKILHWRKENSQLIAYGTMKHFIPFKGIYVYERSLPTKDGVISCLIIANGNDKSSTFNPDRYSEVIGSRKNGRDIISGRSFSLTKTIRLSPRKVLILTF